MRRLILLAPAVLLLACATHAFPEQPAAPAAGRIPSFQVRVRVARSGGHLPSGELFTFRWGRQLAKVRGGAWSPWLGLAFSEAKTGKRYLNLWRRQSRIYLPLQVHPVVDPTLVRVQVRFAASDHTFKLHGELFGPQLGIMIWRDRRTGALRAATLAGYNRRYWPEFDAAALRPSDRPKHFLIVDRFIGADNDLLDWKAGISHLAKIGITAMLVPPSAPVRKILLKNGLHRFALAVAMTPGGPLGLGPKSPSLERWASNFADRYVRAGYSLSDFSLFAIADEPGWYFPGVLHAVEKDPAALRRFRDYLAQQHLTPAMLGANDWDGVHPIGHGQLSKNSPLGARRLFYWTCRFFPWQLAEHMRRATLQLHKAFTPRLKAYSNFNNFSGQYYFQGFRANNRDFRSPDAAMGTPEWFQFGRLHGSDLMWTEDWFGNNRAYQWSFYAARLRSIADANGLGFGGYVVGRTAGKPTDGMLQKILTLVGSGAKTVFYYIFGPEYAFPGNSYSDVPGVVRQFARADKMIAKAEDVLWPGREPHAQVAILQPRSSEVWDGFHILSWAPVVGATNTNPNGETLDYMAEVFDDYLALEMSDIPVDFISENGLTDGALNKYKVLYITEPDIPSRDQRAIARWVKSGGTLAMAPGAAQGNRYDEPSHILTALSGSPRHSRAYLPNVLLLKQSESLGNAPVFGGPPEPAPIGKAISSFKDGKPALQQDKLGMGRILYYSCFPGLAYARLALNTKLGLKPSPQADVLRKLVGIPVQRAGVTPPVRVNTAYVETPMLVSSAGAAITLLNWTGHDLPSLRVTVRFPYRTVRAVSVTRGPIRLRRKGDAVTFSLSLGAADIVKITP